MSNFNQPASASVLQTVFRILLGLGLAYAGIGHLTFLRTDFVVQVPDWVPLPTDVTVVLSGVMEILLGTALMVLGKYRVWIGFAAALFFIAVFPGNISQYVHHINAFHLNTDTARLVRLFFQPVLVVWALWCTGAWHAWRTKSEH